MKTFIIADDHPILLSGIQQFIESLGFKVIQTCENGRKALESFEKFAPDCIILDINMPLMNGIEVLEKIRLKNKNSKVILYTMYHEKSFFNKAKSLGVNGYILKDFAIEELEICIEKVFEGINWFSPKLEKSLIIKKHDDETTKILTLTASELKILTLIGSDYSTKSIAEMLFVSEKTIEKHRSNIIKKLGLPNEHNILQRFALQNFDKIKNL